MYRPQAAFLLEKEAYDAVFSEREFARLRERLRFPIAPIFTDGDLEKANGLEDIEVLISGWGMPRNGKALTKLFPNLKFVAHAGGSVKFFVTDEMWENGVRVVSAAKANAVPVAEFALSQIIYTLKHGWQRVREIEDTRTYSNRDDTMPGVHRSTVGILSYGLIGRLLRRLLRQLEVDVLVYDPYLSDADCMGEDIELASLEEVFSRADVVSCHTPQLPETEGMISGVHFGSMKVGASFINTARGGVVNEQEMIDVLQERLDLMAILDVTEPEPPEPDSPLFRMRNVVLTPHIAGSLGGECLRMGRLVVSEIEKYLNEEPLDCEVFGNELRFLA